MSMKWAKGLPWWTPYQEAGKTYALSHLHPFRYHISLDAKGLHAARIVEIRVAFESHTFTVGQITPQSAHPQYSRGPRDQRRFCPVRYELSKLLPDVIRNLHKRKCYFTRRNNYFVAEFVDGYLTPSQYWIFFDVRGTDDPQAVLVRVLSAYVADKPKAPAGITKKKVSFAVLVGKALLRQRARPPP